MTKADELRKRSRGEGIGWVCSRRGAPAADRGGRYTAQRLEMLVMGWGEGPGALDGRFQVIPGDPTDERT